MSRALSICMVLTAWAISAFSQSTSPVRLGVARELSVEDVAALEATIPDGKKPWLLIGNRGMRPSSHNIHVYLSAETTTAAMRRGTMVIRQRNAPTSNWVSIDRINWAPFIRPAQLSPSATWMQLALEGRSFDDIRGDDDPNLPFLVHGNLDDATVRSIIASLRTSQPIMSIFRLTEDSVRVEFRLRGNSQDWNELQRQGHGWVVLRRGTARG
jgi:hypothetical protein